LKKSKTLNSNNSGHIEGDIMQNHEKKKRLKKSEKPRFYGQTNFFISTLPFSTWAVLARVLFFWLQNMEGLTLVGVFMEGTTLTC
jgi:hypothetical protein